MKSTDNKNSLTQSLNIQPSDVVAFVGAGGKTSLMLALAEELFSNDLKVVMTTTTKIGTSELPQNQPSELIIGTDADEIVTKIISISTQHKIPVLASGIDDTNNRLLGIDPKIVELLSERKEIDVILLEADGARRKPFKIPMPHEPVIPECTTKLCIVAGLDALGLELTEENFYNTTGMQDLGAILGEPLTPDLLRGLLLHQTGYVRLKTYNRQLFLILNKADKIHDDMQLFEVVRELFHNDFENILVTTTKDKCVVRSVPDNTYHHITGIILAAGMSRRFTSVKHVKHVKQVKRVKQLADIGGSSLIYRVTDHALASELNSVVLVAGFKFDEVVNSLGNLVDNNKLSVIRNRNYMDGMSSSIIAGLKYALKRSDAVMIILGDQPNITAEILNKIIDAYRKSNARLCLPMIENDNIFRPGNPVIFNQELFPELLQIEGDIGGRQVVSRNYGFAKFVEFIREDTQLQINTQEDLDKYLTKLHKTS